MLEKLRRANLEMINVGKVQEGKPSLSVASLESESKISLKKVKLDVRATLTTLYILCNIQ